MMFHRSSRMEQCATQSQLVSTFGPCHPASFVSLVLLYPPSTTNKAIGRTESKTKNLQGSFSASQVPRDSISRLVLLAQVV